MSESIVTRRQMTARQFLDYFINDVVSEARLTEENNEDRTLGDYLADLSGLCERIIARESDATDPLDASVKPLDRWVSGRDLTEAIADLCACPDTDNPEYVRGAWETTLNALGVATDEARDEDGILGGAATRSVLTTPRPVIQIPRRVVNTAAAVLGALGYDREGPDWSDAFTTVVDIVHKQEAIS